MGGDGPCVMCIGSMCFEDGARVDFMCNGGMRRTWDSCRKS